MAYCSKCGKQNSNDALFCGNCGNALVVISGQREKYQESENLSGRKSNGSWIDSLNEYIGNDRPANLNWRVLFTDVFKRHTTEEAEDIFICGTKTTTPQPSDVSKDWPHPWLYSRVLMMFLITFSLLWICVSAFENTNALPGMIVIGSFTVPLSTMILFMEANVWRNISMFRVIKIFFVGGCASLVATLFLFSFYSVTELDFWGAFMVGIIEEIGKAVIVYMFLKRLGKHSILTGLLIGASVGAGFAAFESAGYALQPFMQFQQIAGYAAAYGQNVDGEQMMDAINRTIFLRGILAPGGHVAWAAISGAALVIVAKAMGGFESSIVTDQRFLRLFAIPVVLHGLWDSPLASWCNGIFPFLGYIILFVLVWVVVLILFNMGLAEVSRYNSSCSK
ncbi:MAG: PrsW family intramembrane metalloprotease [Prevotella sp.]|nr:PrsW family intramembrane metalloprotease [Prevotella sp.]